MSTNSEVIKAVVASDDRGTSDGGQHEQSEALLNPAVTRQAQATVANVIVNPLEAQQSVTDNNVGTDQTDRGSQVSLLFSLFLTAKYCL